MSYTRANSQSATDVLKPYWVGLIVLGLVAGCSYYHGKGGVIDQAMLKDIAAEAKSKGKHQCDGNVLLETCSSEDLAQCIVDCDRFLQEEPHR